MERKQTSSSSTALGGVLAAVAVVIMCLGGLIPIATYTSPMLCMLLLQLIARICGKRIAWAWYGVVSFLSLLLSPDKEAAFTFLFLGYYPIVKPGIDRKKGKWVRKLALFNASLFAMYALLISVLGFESISEEFGAMNLFMILVLVALGNVTFVLLDRVLEMDVLRKLGFRGK